MKTCPVCDSDFPDQHNTCPTDGAVLIVSHELAAGSLVRGKYRIVRKLGQGGMGTVYLAEHLLLGGRAALKFLAVELSRNPQFIKRFRNEARAAFQLRHPNIVEVMDLDQAEDGSLFIAMEFVEGPSLRAALGGAPAGLEIARALELGRGIASGLAAAHARGTVHRDIKPENILLTSADGRAEQPKVLDFGIAAMLEGATAVSQTRGLMLTAEYASPEQWRGTPAADLDGRTDLYALGGVFYEMLTGRKPFHAHNMEGWMFQHLQETPPPPSFLRAELADWIGLDDLVMRLLAKNRDDRPSDAEARRLLDAVRHSPAKAPPETIFKEERARSETVVEQRWERPETVVERDWARREPAPKPPPMPPQRPVISYGQPEAPEAEPADSPQDDVWVEPPSRPIFSASQPKAAGPGRKLWKVWCVVAGLAAGIVMLVLAANAVFKQSPESLNRKAGEAMSQNDYSKAVDLYTKACGEGLAISCVSLGLLYEKGQGVAPDASHDNEIDYFGRACSAGNADGCNNLGEFYEMNEGDPYRAQFFYKRACDSLGDAEGCRHRGSYFRKLLGSTRDPVRYSTYLPIAKEYYQMACNKGDQSGCDELKELEALKPLNKTVGNSSADQKRREEAARKLLE
jgi:serine/threonine protein kinase